mgnify:CR=1 FL=1|jgi:hypothetical protein
MDFVVHNREAWNREVEKGSIWAKPVDTATIEEARKGKWSVLLTPTKPVPLEWFPSLCGKKILCLASGGGQIDAGFMVRGFYEDSSGGDDLLDPDINTFIATRAVKY